MWYRAYTEVIKGVVHLGEEIPWDDDELRVELDWTSTVLTMVYMLGHWIAPNYDPSVIETYPLGSRLMIAQFRYPGGNMGAATISEDPYIVHIREVDRGQAGGQGGEMQYVNRAHLYLRDERLYKSHGGGRIHGCEQESGSYVCIKKIPPYGSTS